MKTSGSNHRKLSVPSVSTGSRMTSEKTKDRKQYNAKTDPKHNISLTIEGKCGPLPAGRPRLFLVSKLDNAM